MKRPLQNFGPWASNLNSPTRLFLSSFWRRRMHTISQLRHTSTRVNRQVLVACGLVMLAIVGVPLVQFAPAAPAVEGEKPDGPFVATFSNGVTVELIGLSVNPSPGEAWWKPDGSPLADRPYKESRARMSPGPDGISREVCWRWQNPGDPDVQTHWGVIPHPNSFGQAFGRDNEGNSVDGVTGWAFGLPTNRKTCTLRFTMTLPSSEWESVIESQAGYTSGTSKAGPGGKTLSAMFGRPRLFGGDTVVTVTYQIPDHEVRLVAEDHDGKLHIAKSTGGGGAGSFVQTEYLFAGVEPEQLATWQLQARTRKAEVIEFQNVSLHPDVASEVVIRKVADEVESGDRGQDKDAARGESLNSALPANTLAQSSNSDQAQQRYERQQELIAELRDQHDYRLAEGELIKYVADAPEWLRQALLHNIFAVNEPEHTDFENFYFLFKAVNERDIDFAICSANYKEAPTLQQILRRAFFLKRHRIRGDDAILKTGLPGDWILSWDAREYHPPAEAEFAALERILNEQLNLGVRLRWQEVMQPVLVVTGKHPKDLVRSIAHAYPGMRFVADSPDPWEVLGEGMMIPIIDETTDKPANRDLPRKAPDDPIYGNAPLDAETRQMVLEEITWQTGLTFTEDVRPVKTLVIERAD